MILKRKRQIVQQKKHEIEFCGGFAGVQVQVHANARDKGFWDACKSPGEAIALMHSELSEALEALRDGNPKSKKIPEFSHLEEELADVVIRIMDFAGGHGLEIASAIIAKHRFNMTRPHKHGKEF